MRIIAQIQNMASSEILSMIPASEYERIKRKDPKPLFKAYVIGHEGESAGTLLGAGTVVAKWFTSAIRNLYEKIQFGLKIFHDHGKGTNSHEGRTPIGEVVGKALRQIKDRLSTIAVVYIKPEFRNIPLDVASIEAKIHFEEDENEVYTAEVGEISAIALGNSAVNKPGFAGATLLAQVQAFTVKKSAANHAVTSVPSKGKGITSPCQHSEGNMDKEEILAAIKAAGLHPSDLFDTETLSVDPAVTGLIRGEVKKAVAGEFRGRKDAEEKLEAQKKEFEQKISDLSSQVASKDAEILKTRIPALVAKASVDRKLTDQQKRFIESRIDRFSPKKAETLEADLTKHLDDEIGEFKKTADLFGIKIEEQKPEGEKTKEKGSGAEPSSGGGSGQIEDKYLDPKQNPFIPQPLG